MESKSPLITNALKELCRFLRYLKPVRRFLVIKIVLELICTVIVFFSPLISKLLIDHALLGKDIYLLNLFVVIGVILAAVTLFNTLVIFSLNSHIQIKFRYSFVRSFYRHLLNIPYSEIKKRTAGRILFRLMQDTEQVLDTTVDFIPNLALHIFRSIALVVVCSYFNIQITLVLLLVIPIYFIYSNWFGKRQSILNRKTKEFSEVLYESVSSTFSHIKALKANRKERSASNDFLKNIIALARLNIRNTILEFYSRNTAKLLFGTIIFGITYYFLIAVVKGKISLGLFVAFSMYVGQLFNNFKEYGTIYHHILAVYPAFERTSEILKTRISIQGNKSINTACKDIVLKDVGCNIEQNPVFQNVNITFEEREAVVITGPNGSGKTTLINVISGLLPPSHGTVCIGSIPLNKCSTSALHRFFSVVYCDDQLPQYLLDKPFRLPKGHLLLPRLLNVISKSENFQSIDKRFLEYGKLSTGQRLLYLIYLAAVRNPYCLMLDEPFANLDEFRVSKLCEVLREVKRKMTLIIATNTMHSISQFADKVYCIKDHKVKLISSKASKEKIYNAT